MTQTHFKAVNLILQTQAYLESRFDGAISAVHGLGLKELHFLMHVKQAPGSKLTRVDLAKRLYVNPSTATRMARPLEKIGLIDRESDPRDARLAYVVLTEAGHRILEEASLTMARLSENVFEDRLDIDEIETMTGLIGRMTAGLPGRLQ